MNNNKSSIRLVLDFIRNLLIVACTSYFVFMLWQWHWASAIVGAIPVYVISLNIVGFLTLPLYYFTPEHKQSKYTSKIMNEFGIDIEVEAINMLEEFKQNQVVNFSPDKFSNYNYEIAKNHIEDLTNCLKENETSYCKSYKLLKYPKHSIELAFHYLLDSIKFDSNCPIYNNVKFANNLRERHMQMLLTFVDSEVKEIPQQLGDQITFNSKRKINIAENELKVIRLINWRSTEQWQYFLDSFGAHSELGKLCSEKIN